MKKVIVGWVLIFGLYASLLAQGDYVSEIRAFQHELNKEYKDPKTSPLSSRDRKKFESHEFFTIDNKYRINAKFKPHHGLTETIHMETSSGMKAKYDKFGIVEFELDGQVHQLTVYQSHRLREMEEYKDHLFLPFTDMTSGDDSYGAGRYLDLIIPDGDQIILDFNKAYNPYCAYSEGYSCPIPPSENNLQVRIESGIKYKY
ncbi:DUF1684 domain-containing protein [Reichenbachiella ulvae]|uniref:DUF1684 domain-containing protein n=1 Tax=Reichenbachiella ulvae TaxID=2980104 RepID=A0ABT3CNZ4_9BACT|nr:DUF1684 domain-containing protein [Reichenbachiella ulvae]MCV9385349.1 DUF1684 domain-containing protein [Reichenbachiella ulvae]